MAWLKETGRREIIRVMQGFFFIRLAAFLPVCAYSIIFITDVNGKFINSA